MNLQSAERSHGTICLAAIATLGCAMMLRATAAETPALGDLAITKDDRVLVLSPHPDDEVLACGGVIQRAKALGIPVRVVFLTYGDNNEWSFAVYRNHPVFVPAAVKRMGEVRRGEAIAAGRTLGLDASGLVFLGYPDFGLLSIWCNHWGAEAPLRSMLTRAIAVPYADAFRPGAAYKGEEVLRDLKNIMREFKPTKVFVSHPADHNPDHQALYLFTAVALWDLREDTRPVLLPYLIHFRNWPQPQGYRSELAASPPKALQGLASWVALPLQPAEIGRKRDALLMHKTQYDYSSTYLLSFVRRSELFGDFQPISYLPAAPGPDVELELAADAASAESHPFLQEEERAGYVGVERRSLRLVDGALEISLTFSKPLMETTGSSIYAFGYRHDKSFEKMPKIHVEIGFHSHWVHDQSRRLPSTSCSMSRTANRTVVRIPLSVLGDPERILTSARTQAAGLPLDWAAWRVVECGGGKSARTTTDEDRQKR